MLKMWRKPFWQGYLVGGIVVTLISLSIQFIREQDCEAKHSVSDCRAIYVPVTPDGQPLDMSDPFHGEDE